MAPCSVRPTMMPMMPGDSAAMTDPTTITATRISTIRRLPYMSPRRPEIGVITAAASRVEVTTQAVSSRLASSSSGSFDWIGTISVNMNDEHRPADASTAMMAPCLGIRVRRLRASSSRDPIASGYRRARGGGWPWQDSRRRRARVAWGHGRSASARLRDPGIEIRPLETIEQIHEAADVLREVWVGDRDAMPPNLHAGARALRQLRRRPVRGRPHGRGIRRVLRAARRRARCTRTSPACCPDCRARASAACSSSTSASGRSRARSATSRGRSTPSSPATRTSTCASSARG